MTSLHLLNNLNSYDDDIKYRYINFMQNCFMKSTKNFPDFVKIKVGKNNIGSILKEN
jgi:hypothetical protein